MGSDIGVDDLVADFVVECREDLDGFELDLVGLEKDPGCRELLDSAFRALHTVKGTAAYFGFARLESVTHLGESVLAGVRDGTVGFFPPTVTTLLQLSDAIRSLLSGIETTGQEPSLATEELEATLRTCAQAAPVTPGIRQRFGETLVAAGAVTPGDIAWAVAQQAAGDTRPIGGILLAAGLVDAGQIESVLTLQGRGVADSSVRVDLDVLDRLVQLSGRLARIRDEVSPTLDDALSGRLDEITRELRTAVLRTRMEPVDRLWSALPRMVRDLAESSGKRVHLVTEAHAGEVDRALLAAVKDPLTHLVRNAVAHGVESIVERRAAGKGAEGTLIVTAEVTAEELVVEVRDDGRGIDLVRVGGAAVARGVLTAAGLAALSREEVIALVFHPGLSTAAEVTSVAGRGTGLDVVRSDVERAGGRVEVETTRGRGCLVRMRLPHVSEETR